MASKVVSGRVYGKYPYFCKNKKCKFYQSDSRPGDECKKANLSLIANHLGYGGCYVTLSLFEKFKTRFYGHYVSLR